MEVQQLVVFEVDRYQELDQFLESNQSTGGNQLLGTIELGL